VASTVAGAREIDPAHLETEADQTQESDETKWTTKTLHARTSASADPALPGESGCRDPCPVRAGNA
jgi:hypothetical protein